MADSIKGKLHDAGEVVADAASNVGHKIAEGATQAADFVKDKVGLVGHAAKVQDHMEVVGSCGTHVGTVDHLDGTTIKLTRKDAAAGGEHHWIPLSWVASVDDKVRLTKNHLAAMAGWSSDAASAGA